MSPPITIAPHLQRALEAMSKDMAVEPQALVNQAVFAWLRINGYVLPGAAPLIEVPSPVVVAPPAPVVVAPPAPVVVEPPVPVVVAPPAPVVVAPPAPVVVAPPVEVPVPVAAPVRSRLTPIPAPPPEPPAPVPVVVPVVAASPPPGALPSELAPALARMAQIDADLEKLTKPWPAWAAPVAQEDAEEDEPPAVEPPPD